jgi:hypothetical protein
LILTLVAVIKKAKVNSKTKIINMVDEDASKKVEARKNIK